MKQTSTDQLLTLGMALYADQRTMKTRIVGIFAGRRTSALARQLLLTVTLALLVACFTTACQPVRDDALVSNGNALASGGDAFASSGDALASGGNAAPEAGNYVYNRDVQRENDARERENRRASAVPQVNDSYRDARGEWIVLDATETNANALASFLEIANSLFDASYAPEQVTVTRYHDNTELRGDVWRIDSADGKLAGAIDVKTGAFLSADYAAEAADALNASYAPSESGFFGLDVSAAIDRILSALHMGSASQKVLTGKGGSSRSKAEEQRGWNVQETYLLDAGEGRFIGFALYGDENLTLRSVGVYPDADCGDEGVFWRADLLWAEGVNAQLHPQDFALGEPLEGDMTQDEAIDLYTRLVEAAGTKAGVSIDTPKLTFYVDGSGARDNYWHIEGALATFNVASHNKNIFQFVSEKKLGYAMGLTDIPYEQMGGAAYESATQKLFEAILGAGSVSRVQANAVYDNHYCTMDPETTDGAWYEIMYEDGLIREITFFPASGQGEWYWYPNWLADWEMVNTETGETFWAEW